MAKKEKSIEDINREALQAGTVWLNPAFSSTNSAVKTSRQLVSFLNLRMSTAEKVWAGVGMFVVLILLLISRAIFGTWSVFYLFNSFYFMPFWVIIIGYQAKALANASPLRRETGEGSTIWLKMLLGKFVERVERKIMPNQVQYTQVIVRKGRGRDRTPRVQEAILFQGTAPVPESGLRDHSPVPFIAGRPVWEQEPEYYDYTRGNVYRTSMRGEFVPR